MLYYHGTTSDVSSKILSSGLRTGSDGYVWLTTDRSTAFLNGAMRTWRQKKNFSIKPVILAVNLPDDFAVIQRGLGDATTTSNIAPEFIIDEPLTTDENDEFEWVLALMKRTAKGWINENLVRKFVHLLVKNTLNR